MILGAAGKFGQGDNPNRIAAARAIGVRSLRDDFGWKELEASPGVYALGPAYAGFLQAERQHGVEPMLIMAYGNPHYDGGNTPYSDAGLAAFRNYCLEAIRLSGVSKINVWNEPNGDFMSGPAARDKAQGYARLLKAVYQPIKATYPRTEVIGGISNLISHGWYADLFTYGALHHLDALSFHPYRPIADGLTEEIELLRGVMRYFGREVPLYVTEMGDNHSPTDRDAQDYLVKMMVALAAAGVKAAYWYQLAPWQNEIHRTLLDADNQPTAIGRTFKTLSDLLAVHTPRRDPQPDPRVQLYRLGPDVSIVWSRRSPVRIRSPGLTYRTFDGARIGPPAEIDANPILVTGGRFDASFGPSRVLANTRYDWMNGTFELRGRRVDNWEYAPTVTLGYFGARIGHPSVGNLSFAPGVVDGGESGGKVYAVFRHKAPRDYGLVSFRFRGLVSRGNTDGIDLNARINGATIAEFIAGQPGQPYDFVSSPVTLQAGDSVDLAVAWNREFNNDRGDVVEMEIIEAGHEMDPSYPSTA